MAAGNKSNEKGNVEFFMNIFIIEIKRRIISTLVSVGKQKWPKLFTMEAHVNVNGYQRDSLSV